MLHFFRRFQQYFYILVTVAIVVSFSFFGTNSLVREGTFHEQVAFTAVDGTEISRADLDLMVLFLATDATDKLYFGGAWGPNFLNNGVIEKEFLQTGLAELLALQYAEDISPDIQQRLDKEKRFTLYTHPQAKFVGVEQIWTNLAPDIKYNYDKLRSMNNPGAPEAFKTRVQLYLAERKLPAPLLKRLLAYQQRQYQWLAPDSTLDYTDLSMFGYHTLDDWFGPKALRVMAQFVINSAIIAEQRGYEVTRAEAVADLMQNAEMSYQQNKSNPNIGVASSMEYYNEQLRRMNIDQTRASQVWRQVLLFRRLYQDLAHSVFVDPMSFEKFDGYAKENIEGELYRLPEALRLRSFTNLQQFEAYLNAISSRSDDAKSLLALPTTFKAANAVAESNPELVQKRYILDIAQTKKETLQARVSVKDTWSWELEEKNWVALKKEFPDLGVKKADSRDERLAALDSLDEKSRAKVDAFARKQIVEAHPEWLDSALADTKAERFFINLNLKNGDSTFIGLQNPKALIELLDKAKLGEKEAALSSYSADKNNYYRIVVIDRSPSYEILTFDEALSAGSLDEAAKNVNTATMDKLSQAIRADYAAAIAPQKAPSEMIPEVVASLRFYNYARDVFAKIKKDPANASAYVQTLDPKAEENKLTPRLALGEQFKLEKSFYHSDRGGGPERTIDLTEAFALPVNSWSKVYTPVNGDLYFFQVKTHGSSANPDVLASTVHIARKRLGIEAERSLTYQLLQLFKEKNAISLEYMNSVPEIAPPPAETPEASS